MIRTETRSWRPKRLIISHYSSIVWTLGVAFRSQNRQRRYCVLKGHINIICPHSLPLVVIGGAPLLPWDRPLMDDSSWSPTPSLERMTHHSPLSPPLDAGYRLVRPLFLAPQGPPPQEKDDTPLPPLPSTWFLLQTGMTPPLGSAGGLSPLGVCYRLV